MFRSFLIISFRNLIRQKGFSIINLSGLTLGLTVGFTILLYVFNELSYDNFHENPEQIFRVAISGNLGDMPLDVAVTPGALGQNLKSDMPDLESYTMFEHVSEDLLFSTETIKFYENHLIYADNSFFDIFSVQFIYGNPEESLSEAYSLVLTQTMSNKLFSDENPLGKEVRLNNANNYVITGVIEDLPAETHMPINCVASFETRIREKGIGIFEDWGSLMYYTYIKLYQNTDFLQFENKLKSYINTKMEEDIS